MAGSASALRAARILQAGGTGTCASTDGDDARRSAAMSSSAVGVLVGAVARGLPPTAYSSTRPVLRNPLGTRAADARARPPVPTVHRRSSHVSGASPLSTCSTQRRMPPCLHASRPAPPAGVHAAALACSDRPALLPATDAAPPASWFAWSRVGRSQDCWTTSRGSESETHLNTYRLVCLVTWGE
jgi:hypothetical protein